MPRKFNLDLDNNLFFKVCEISSILGISPAAFVERSIRYCIENNSYVSFNKRPPNKLSMLESKTDAICNRHQLRQKTK